MPRRKDPQHAERRRADLVKAGYAEILEHGIQGTTMDSVAARAGWSKGAALYYFPTKDGLLLAVLNWLLGELDRSLDDIAESQAAPRRRLASELEVLFHSADVNRKLYLVLMDFITLGARSERYRAPLAAFLERCRRRDTAIVAEGIKKDEFRRVDPENAASTIRGLVDGLCLQWLIASDSAPLEVYRDRCRAVLGAYLLR